MARLTRWLQKLLRRTSNPPTSVAAPEASIPKPRAVHMRHCELEAIRRPKLDGGGYIVVVILGSPGIGRRSLRNKLLYDDMNGGELYELSMLLMDDETPMYLCGECEYYLDVLVPASEPGLGYYWGAVHKFFSVILAYDVHSQASFDEMSRLYDTVAVHLKSGQPGINISVLGLKTDLDSAGGRVPRETGEAFAAERGCSFAECSAKSGDGVYEAFGMAVECAHSITTHFSGDSEGQRSYTHESAHLLARAMQSIDRPQQLSTSGAMAKS